MGFHLIVWSRVGAGGWKCALTINAINWVLSPYIRLYLLGIILAKDTSDIASSVSIFSICALGGVAHLGWLPWIPTPNYNSLTMFGLLIFASAFLPVFRSADARISPAILGVSAAIIFMGKPSSALSLGFIFPLLLFRLSVLEFCGISLRAAIWFLASILVVFFYIFQT